MLGVSYVTSCTQNSPGRWAFKSKADGQCLRRKQQLSTGVAETNVKKPGWKAQVDTCTIACAAIPNSDVAVEALGHVVQGVREEIVVESGLHVPALAAASCQQKFGSVGAVAPPLKHPAEGSVPTGVSDQEMELAVCLLTPTEQVSEANDVRIMQTINNLMERAEIEAAACDMVGSRESTLTTRVRSPRCTKGRRKGEGTREAGGMEICDTDDELVGNIVPCILQAVRSSVTSPLGLGDRK